MSLLTALSIGMIFWSVITIYKKYQLGTLDLGVVISGLIFTSLFVSILAITFNGLKSITISDEYLEYHYTLFPFRKIVIQKSKFDGYVVVMEKRQTVMNTSDVPFLVDLSDKQAVWLFKDGRLSLRLSTMIYKNYDELKKELNDLTELNIEIRTSFEQLFYFVGLKRVNKN